MGPKLMNCCKPDPMGTHGYAKMLKRIQDWKMVACQQRSWRIEGQKKRITRIEYQRLLTSLKWKALWRKKGLWNLVGEKIMRERGALPKEECDVIREYKAIHEENFLSSWLREDEEDKKVRNMNKKDEKT